MKDIYMFPRPPLVLRCYIPAQDISTSHPGPSLDDVSSPHMVIISPLLRLYEDVVTSHWLMPETMPQHMSSLKINVSQADFMLIKYKSWK